MTFIDWLQRRRWRVLLALLIAGFLADPLFDPAPWAPIAANVLFAGALGGAAYASRLPGWAGRLAAGVVSIWLVLITARAFGAGDGMGEALFLLTLVIAFGALATTLNELLQRRAFDIAALFEAIVGYFLIATAWGLLYVQIEAATPGAFTLDPQDEPEPQLLYFSLVTLTTLGYGDITPTAPLPRILTGLQAAFGTLYIAILIGRIVGGLKPPPPGPDA